VVNIVRDKRNMTNAEKRKREKFIAKLATMKPEDIDSLSMGGLRKLYHDLSDARSYVSWGMSEVYSENSSVFAERVDEITACILTTIRQRSGSTFAGQSSKSQQQTTEAQATGLSS